MKYFSPLIATLVAITIQAQTYSYTYEYDNSGNRISRVLTLEQADKNLTQEEVDDEIYRDQHTVLEVIEEQYIRLFPNPTVGNLIVEIENSNAGQERELSVISLGGQVILSQKLSEGENNIDFTDFKPGTYIVTLTLGKNTRKYKLVKL